MITTQHPTKRNSRQVACLCGVLLLACLGGCRKPDPAPPSTKPIVIENFDVDRSSGLYAALVKHPKLDVIEGMGAGGSRGLKATYQGYPRGSERIVVEHGFGERGASYTLCYDVKFDDDFQFVKGGKIMGLGPDRKITGGNKVTPGGWSARSNFAREGGIHTYVYSQNKDGQWGQSEYSEGPVFQKGRYHRITLQVRLNDPVGEANGAARIYVDGRLQVKHEGIQYRSVPGDSTLISKILFETFHGGNTEDYAPRDENGNFATVHAYFDNIAVYRGFYLCLGEG